MKIHVILIFTFFYVQTSASLYGRFRGAMSNVERGFDKLISDVVIDVKDTVHCTISAVEQVLVKNGLLQETSDYDSKCRGYLITKTPKSRSYGFRSFFEERNKNIQSTHLSPESEFEHMSNELETSVVNVNNSVNDILGRREAKTQFQVISDLMKDEEDRLNAVSELLRREFENLSINVRHELLKLHNGVKKHPRDKILEDLKAMQHLKSRSKSKIETNEINNIIDKVVNKLLLTPDDKVLSEKEKLEEIEKQLNKYKSEIQNDQTAFLNAQEIENKISTKTEVKSFKDLAQNIMNNDNRVITDNKIAQVFPQEVTSQGLNVENLLLGGNTAAMDSSSPFYNPTPFSETKNMVEDAKAIMEESKKSEELLNHFFEEQHSNADVFSSGHLFNF